jgi:hypothetical protein
VARTVLLVLGVALVSIVGVAILLGGGLVLGIGLLRAALLLAALLALVIMVGVARRALTMPAVSPASAAGVIWLVGCAAVLGWLALVALSASRDGGRRGAGAGVGATTRDRGAFLILLAWMLIAGLLRPREKCGTADRRDVGVAAVGL